MFYRFVRSVVSFALRLFYRVKVNAGRADFDGPVMYVGNHPNGLIDPALIFVISRRHVTFLAKAPLFKMPGIGQILKGLGALPVYRKQDDPTLMAKNEGTLEAAAGALVQGRAITLFPEGKSHSEPALAEVKTGAARIALRAARQGAKVQVVPVGLTYAEKNRFRSEVLIDVGQPIDAAALLPAPGQDEAEAVRKLTAVIADGLRRITLNLEQWEDLPLIQFAEALYALRTGEAASDPERMRSFAKGIQLFRAEQPDRFQRIRAELVTFRDHLHLARVNPQDLKLIYRPLPVLWFVIRNLAALALGLPLFALGLALFAVPFYVPRLLPAWLKVDLDAQATVKFFATLLIAPVWIALLTAAGWALFRLPGALIGLLGSLPLAIFTRYFLEHWRRVFQDVRTFFAVGTRASLKARLSSEGERLAAQVEAVAQELRPRVVDAPANPAIKTG